MSNDNRMSSIFDEIPVSDFDELALRNTKVLSPVETEPVWRFIQDLYNRKNKFTRPDPKYRLMACMLNAVLHEKKSVFLMSTFIMEKLYEKDENIKAKAFHSGNFNAMMAEAQNKDRIFMLEPPTNYGGPGARAGKYKITIDEFIKYIDQSLVSPTEDCKTEGRKTESLKNEDSSSFCRVGVTALRTSLGSPPVQKVGENSTKSNFEDSTVDCAPPTKKIEKSENGTDTSLPSIPITSDPFMKEDVLQGKKQLIDKLRAVATFLNQTDYSDDSRKTYFIKEFKLLLDKHGCIISSEELEKELKLYPFLRFAIQKYRDKIEREKTSTPSRLVIKGTKNESGAQ